MDPMNAPRLSAEEGARRLGELAHDAARLGREGDLRGAEALFDAMENVVAATGVELPGLSDRIQGLRRAARDQQRQQEAVDAAMWAGDFARARRLMDGGADALAQLFEGDEDDTAPKAEEAWTDSFDAEAFAALLAAEKGLAAPSPDLYADLSAGVPGAAAALVAAGRDLNTPSGEARHTAILAALDAPARRAETLETLIAAGADACVIHEVAGDNAFSWAIGYDHAHTIDEETELQLFSVLVSAGVDPDHMIPGQMAVLHWGILKGATPQVEALLSIGADPDQPLPEAFEPRRLAGGTPLMLAAPKPDLVRRLLDHGADAAAPDARGRNQLAFLGDEARAARGRIDPDDPWTGLHARALDESLALIRAHLGA